MSASSNGKAHVTLWDVGDAEMLAIVDDLADENGWATVADVQHQLGENPFKVMRSNVGQRLGWLRRYGWLEKGERERVTPDEDTQGTYKWTQTYRLTAMGQALVDNPQLSRSIESALAKLNPAQRLQLTRELGERGANAPDEIRHALRREWQRSLGVGRPRR